MMKHVWGTPLLTTHSHSSTPCSLPLTSEHIRHLQGRTCVSIWYSREARASPPRNRKHSKSSWMFYTSVWDPRLILSQIFAMQCAFYLLLGLFFFVLDALMHHDLSMEQIFSYRTISFHTSLGWVTVFGYALSAVAGSFCLLFIVERSKKCLDHTATMMIIHLLCCTLYDKFPTSWSWWIVNIVCMIIMAIVGEYLCMRKELKEIPINRGAFANSTSEQQQHKEAVIEVWSKRNKNHWKSM